MVEEGTYRARLAVQREAEALRTEQLWIQKPLPAIPTLEELRKTVLQRNPERCPKWRFRLADDLVTQLQPRAWGALFEGVVYEGKDLPLDAFQKKAKGFYRIKYLLVEDEVVPGWNFRARRVAWPQGGDREQKTDHLIELQWRMLAALPQLNQPHPIHDVSTRVPELWQEANRPGFDGAVDWPRMRRSFVLRRAAVEPDGCLT